MRWATKSAALFLIGLPSFVWLSTAAPAAGRDEFVFDPPIAGPAISEPGAWRTRTQQVFDPVERELIRRLYTVWDANPSDNLEFVWIPDSLSADREGLINGQGRLIWRLKVKPSYDASSIFAEFRGSFKDGRAEGRGTYFNKAGMAYEGDWQNGMMEGHGALKLPSTDEYFGQFRAGKANGSGRYIEMTGEIFEGAFIGGLREGRGTTTLPNGASYRSTWEGGRETEGSRSVRLAQLGGQPASGGADDVRLGISVDRERAKDGYFQYAASSAGSGLSIRPENKRLMDMWKRGAPIQLLKPEEEGEEYGVFSLVQAQLAPLTFVLEVHNRSSASLQVVGAYFDVQASASDLQPAIQLRVGSFEMCSGQPEYRPVFKLENFGWGAAERATLRFAFAQPNADPRSSSAVLSKDLGRINNSVAVDMEPHLRNAGVDTDLLRRRAKAGLSCRSRDRAACLDELKSSGVFGSLAQHVALDDTNLVLSAVGTLQYDWSDVKGAQRNTASPFNARLLLGHVVREAECGEGGGREPVTARPLDFRLEQSNYRLPFAFQRSVPAGRMTRFTVQVRAARSSEHDFRVVLQLADGREISSRPINLLYYVPRWFPGS